MTKKIGEIFEFEGVKLQVVEGSEYETNCIGCYYRYNCSGFMSANCTPCTREDRKYVKYKKVSNYK